MNEIHILKGHRMAKERHGNDATFRVFPGKMSRAMEELQIGMSEVLNA